MRSYDKVCYSLFKVKITELYLSSLFMFFFDYLKGNEVFSSKSS